MSHTFASVGSECPLLTARMSTALSAHERLIHFKIHVFRTLIKPISPYSEFIVSFEFFDAPMLQTTHVAALFPGLGFPTAALRSRLGLTKPLPFLVAYGYHILRTMKQWDGLHYSCESVGFMMVNVFSAIMLLSTVFLHYYTPAVNVLRESTCYNCWSSALMFQRWLMVHSTACNIQLTNTYMHLCLLHKWLAVDRS